MTFIKGAIGARTPRLEKPGTPRMPERTLTERPSRHYAWQDQAACRGVSAEWFFAPESERIRAREEREETAKRVCSFCPVRERCLDHAQSVPEPVGVWGGLNEVERVSLRRRESRIRSKYGDGAS